jgi:hypothetical protein
VAVETMLAGLMTFCDFSSPNTTVLTRMDNKRHVLFTNMTQSNDQLLQVVAEVLPSILLEIRHLESLCIYVDIPMTH